MIIKALGLKTINGCMNLLQDKNGKMYRIPNFCINDPYFEKVISQYIEKTNTKIKINLYDLYSNNKISVNIEDTISGSTLKDIYCAAINCKRSDFKTFRLFFGGMEILDRHFLCEHKLRDNYTIQIMKS